MDALAEPKFNSTNIKFLFYYLFLLDFGFNKISRRTLIEFLLLVGSY